MAAFFLDSSALVKRYVLEAGSDWVRTICEPATAHRLCVLRLGIAEVAGAFYRRRREGGLGEQETADLVAAFLADCAVQQEVHEVTRDLVAEAVVLMDRHPLRALDAIQLAAVSLANQHAATAELPSLAFVSSDDQLCTIASAEGMLVENPTIHG